MATDTVKASKTLHFSPSDTPERRAALLNELMNELRTAFSAVSSVIGTATFVPLPATAVVSEQAFGQAAAVGSADTFSRGDHTHGTPVFDIPDGFVTEEMTDGTFATLTDAQKLRVELQYIRLLLGELIELEAAS